MLAMFFIFFIGLQFFCMGIAVYLIVRSNRVTFLSVEALLKQCLADQTILRQGHTQLSEKLVGIEHALKSGLDSNDKALRSVLEQHQTSIALLRGEQQAASSSFQQGLTQQFAIAAQQQGEQLKQFSDVLHKTNALLNGQLEHLRQSVEVRLKDLQTDNANKLEHIRKTVDEKLHATLELRLGESFKLVSERLEQVYRGLGEMQTLAIGVGDLKRVLTNVKTRGTWGEIQLESLLEQVLTPEQYGKNIKTVPGSQHLVEFAVKLPGRDANDQPVWLPIDAKFPKEQYERLLDAFDAANIEGVAIAGKALEVAVKLEAKTIAEKYLSPPHTTDFAILFLPTEGLYAEIVKRAGLVDILQREYRVTVAGPVTLTALLNALQLGFRTLALEKRSSEVWTVLGAVKTEFAKFGDILAKTRDTLERAARNIESAQTRTRVMERKLKEVEALPEGQAQVLIGTASGLIDEGDQ